MNIISSVAFDNEYKNLKAKPRMIVKCIKDAIVFKVFKIYIRRRTIRRKTIRIYKIK